MAFQFIRQFTTFSGGVIACYYDATNGDFNFTWSGTGTVPTPVTTSELGASEGDEVSYVCLDGDKHILYATVDAPFLTASIEADSADCIVITPPPPDPPTPPPTDPPPPVLTANYIAYQVKFKNVEEQIVEANIFDQTTYEEGRTIEYRPLKASGEPVRLECIDNDEYKFTPIRAKQCIIEFNSSSQHDLNLFSEGQDNRWYVEVRVADEIKFKGFLVLNDMQEDFLSPPNIVSLTAIDGLGTLKDIPLTNFDGDSPITLRPKNKYRWLDYLGWALSKTSLRLPIRIQHNLREEHYLYEPFWSKIYLDPKTFEQEIGTCVNCYEVLERLLAKECFITQHNGEWWVVRVDELDDRVRFVYTVTSDLTSWTLDTTAYVKQIKKTLDINWINRTAYVGLERPNSYAKEAFKFEYPREILDNIDFSRGGEILIEVLPPNQRHFHLDDWEFGRQPGTTAASAYIRRVYGDYEIERFVVITKSANSGGTHYIQSSSIPVLQKDKFDVSVDRRLSVNRGGSGFFRTGVIKARLHADDGTFYILAGTVNVGGNKIAPTWRTTDSTFTLNDDFIWQEGDLSSDDREWVSTSENAPPFPKDGQLEILLFQTADVPTTADTHFANLQFTYHPYINGTYQAYTGQQWKVSQEGEYKAVQDDNVYISDGTRPLFKGAMLWFDVPAGKWKLTGNWYDYSKSPTIVPVIPATEEFKPYGWWQAQSVWNQYRRVMRLFDGELLGLTENDLPDLTHRYSLDDPSLHTMDRYFMCLHYSMSLKKCRWTAYFAEVFKYTSPKVYTDETEFKYIENR